MTDLPERLLAWLIGVVLTVGGVATRPPATTSPTTAPPTATATAGPATTASTPAPGPSASKSPSVTAPGPSGDVSEEVIAPLESPDGREEDAPLRLLPMGDSITEGVMPGGVDGGYRARMDAGIGVVHAWTGTLGADPLRHEGHSGWTIRTIQIQADLWVHAARPDVVLIHLGTNDFGQGRTTAQAVDDLTLLLSTVHAAAPRAVVLLGQIPETPLNPETQNAALRAYDNLLPGLTNGRPWLRVVDMRGVHISTDRVHPDAAGYAEMGRRWLTVLPRARAAA